MQSTRALTTVGFSLMLALMLALMAASLSRMHAMHDNLRTIVENHNVKMQHVWDMRQAARERAMILHRLMHTEDPFEADDLIRQFGRQAGRFIEARDTLLASALTREERALLETMLKLARVGEATHKETIETFQSGRRDLLPALLDHKVIPAQDRVFRQLDNLLHLEQVSARLAEQEATEAYRSAQKVTLGIGTLFMVVGILVATYIIRRNAQIEQALHSEKERAQVTLHAIGEAVISTDAAGRVTYMNPVASALTGHDAMPSTGRPLGEILHIVEDGTGLRLFQDAPAPIDGELRKTGELVARHGSRHFVELTGNPIHDLAGHGIGGVLVIRDVTEDRALAQQLSWAATHDALTGLINRREFERKLFSLLDDARTEKREHALLYLDLDQFKVVNDTCGHVAGDELLRQLSARLQEHIRNSDTLARLGGDEFGVLLEGCPLPKANAVAEQLRDAVEKFRFMWEGKPFDVGVSIGVAPITAHSESANSLLSSVDAACYVAKDKGRNLVHVFEPDDQETACRTGEMQRAQEVSQAIRENRMVLYAQKIVPLTEGGSRVPHVELLVRMRDMEGRIVPPMSFIPAAERYGLMPSLDKWVVGTVLRCLAERPDTNRVGICAINLSGQTLGDKSALEYILNQFREHGVSPGHVCFEITETAAIANLRAATGFIDTLKAMGCRFALDDFGSGMSSFGYLRQLDVDFLKIDGAFVRDILNDPTDRTMVAAINDIGHAMGLQTIAEFVEDDATAGLLREMGIDYAQGYGIHRPEPIEAMVARFDQPDPA